MDKVYLTLNASFDGNSKGFDSAESELTIDQAVYELLSTATWLMRKKTSKESLCKEIADINFDTDPDLVVDSAYYHSLTE